MRRPSTAVTLSALLAYTAVMLSLTMLKAFYNIGYLWNPEAHRNRSLSLAPFDDLIHASGWFRPMFGYLGNIAFFVPFGILVFVLVYRYKRAVLTTTVVGLGFSICIEIAQYVFALGYSDIDDVMMNTLGAFIGATLAQACGPRMFKVWIGLAFVLGIVFAVLVGLGERLGDPEKIIPA